jgi:two-component system LytT family response regulator
MHYTALIIEDEPAAARRLQKMVAEYEPSIKVNAILDSIKSAVDWFNSHPMPDIIFLDINLGDGLSFAIFEKVEITCSVIFTTAYDEYAIKAFKHNGIDYLLKPIKIEELEFSINKFLHQQTGHDNLIQHNLKLLMGSFSGSTNHWKKRFIVNFGDKIKAIEVADIAYFMILEKYTFLVTRLNESFGINYSLEQLEEVLNPDEFFRANRKFLIRFAAIKNMWSYSRSRVKLELLPPANDDVIVSSERSAAFKEWLNK